MLSRSAAPAGSEGRERDRAGAPGRRPVAELAVGVEAPAADGAPGEEGAGRAPAGADRADPGEGDAGRGEDGHGAGAWVVVPSPTRPLVLRPQAAGSAIG